MGKPADLSSLQRGIATRGTLALLFSSAVIGSAWHFSPRWFPADADLSFRLRLAAAGWLAAGLCLAAAIAAVAFTRFTSARDIGGSAQADASQTVTVRRAILQNTLEQVVLAAIAQISLALALPVKRLAVIPALALVFVIGRAAFAWGLPRGAHARAFGHVATFAPSVAALVWAACILIAS